MGKPRKDTEDDEDLDDDDGEPKGDQWIVAHWFITSWNMRFEAVYQKDGKPRTDWHPTDNPRDMYRWRSYHAARKWLKENPKLKGYIVVNLSEIERLSKIWHRANYPSLYREGGGPLD